MLLAAACSAGTVSSGVNVSQDTAGRTSTIAPDSVPNTDAAPSSTASPSTSEQPTSSMVLDDVAPERASVRIGAQVLVDSQFAAVANLRLGLIVNQTSMVAGEHLIDHVADHPDVELAAIFAPEHGVRGSADAGELVGDTVDVETGVPIFSLYSSARRPTTEMLADVDVLVYDLQDVGTRFYTYISTMGLAMEAANEAGIPFVVLDRPNPLGGEAVTGFSRTSSQSSFVGLYPIPAVYGLTSGELALAIVGEGWLDGTDGLDLQVVEMEGWTRSQRWHDTGIDWIAPSPGLPTADAALVYPGTVLFETTILSYGKGTTEPFTTIGAPWVDGPEVAASLNALDLPGVRFESIVFTPDPAIVPNPRFPDEELGGVRYLVTDRDAFDSMVVGAHVLVTFQRHAEQQGIGSIIDRSEMFDLLAGTTELRRMLDAGASAGELIAAWQLDAEAFESLRVPYLLY